MSDATEETIPRPDGDAAEDEQEEELGEGWVGASRPAKPRTPPPVADRSARPTLYTTVAAREIDASVFSQTVKSNRVWWTPEDDEVPDEDYTPFEVDVSGNSALNEKYTVGETTRRGDFFVIKSAVAKADNASVSVKAIDKATATMYGQSLDELSKEIDMFRTLGACESISTGYELCSGDATLCIVVEPIAGAPLNVQLSRGDENYTVHDARRLVQQCASAVAFVHGAGVVHRDIVPDNFVFTSRTDIESVKLCDFSFARQLAAGEKLDDIPGGDPEFQAPELAREEPHGTACDIWSLGCLAHLLVTGGPPLHDSNSTRLRMKIKKGDVPVAAEGAAGDFCRALLVAEADKRPSGESVLKHAWLASTEDAPLATFKAALKEWNETR